MRHAWVLLALCGGCADQADVAIVGQPSVSVCAAGATVSGVDVSGESPIDWQAFSSGGWDFAIAKASEGVTYVEPVFAANWAAMKAAGIVRGAYCFFRPQDDPVQEADFFVDTVNQAGGFEPGDIPALDLETLDNKTAAEVAAESLAFLERVKADTGITPIIYTSPRVFDSLLGSPAGFSDYPLWDVTWNGGPPACPNIPASWSGWAFWQYAGDSITAPGLPGSLNDGDVFNGTRDDLVAFANGLADVAPTPDGGVSPDGGADAGAGNPADGELTGGCDAGGGAASPAVVGLLLALGLGYRRRRSVLAR